jgi:hypothetical protein
MVLSRVNKTAEFSEIHQNAAESVRTEIKNRLVLLFMNSIFLKKYKKYYKKLEQILSILVKKIFQIYIVWIVKI